MTSDPTPFVEVDTLGTGPVRTERLTRFRPSYRRNIASLTSCSERMEDLAETFPGLLFALATGYGSPETREQCFHMIQEGAPLREAADALGLPFWLRRLPAGAFQSAIPKLPDDDDFLRTVGNALPDTPLEAGHWLERVAYAHAACDAPFATWLGRQSRFPFRRLFPAPFTLLAAWAWYSARTDSFAGSLVRVPFDDQMGVRRAYDEARAWRRRLDLAIALGDGISNTWMKPGEAGGLTFVPLLTLEDFLEEAEAMGNCLDQYAAPIRSGLVRVFSIRRNGEPIANLELSPHEDDGAMPQIEQLRGACNARASARTWQAAYAWLGSQALTPLKAESFAGIDAAWQRVWGPYLAHTAGTSCAERVREFAQESKVLARRKMPDRAAEARPATT